MVQFVYHKLIIEVNLLLNFLIFQDEEGSRAYEKMPSEEERWFMPNLQTGELRINNRFRDYFFGLKI